MADLSIDTIEELILEGFSYRQIADKLGISLGALQRFNANPIHSARVNSALILSAQTFDDKAEEVLLNAVRDGIEMQRARELAQHYRWRASKRNPKRFGDKVDITTDGEKITNLSSLPTSELLARANAVEQIERKK